jgi:hypothetical protein
MNALDRIARLPNWPERMTAPVAAAYMGIGHATFLARYKGTGYREGANVLWARVQLDRIIAEQFGLPMSGAPVATISVEDEIEAWRAQRRARSSR